jgi:hypothetical protein
MTLLFGSLVFKIKPAKQAKLAQQSTLGQGRPLWNY